MKHFPPKRDTAIVRCRTCAKSLSVSLNSLHDRPMVRPLSMAPFAKGYDRGDLQAVLCSLTCGETYDSYVRGCIFRGAKPIWKQRYYRYADKVWEATDALYTEVKASMVSHIEIVASGCAALTLHGRIMSSPHRAISSSST